MVAKPKWLTPELLTRLGVLLCRLLVVEYILGFAFWYALADGLRDKSGTPLGADFLNVYAAGLMALRGTPDAIYDWAAHGAVERTVAGYAAPYFGWHYPPMFLGVAALLAFLPYLSAFALYLGAGLAAYIAVLRRIAPQGRDAIWVLVAFPGVFVNIANGQNGFITAALFGAGLLALEESPWLAGLAFGLLSYKPQFFAVIPLMLLAGGYGRALAATVGAAVAAIGASWVLFGAQTWLAFFDSTKLTQHIILEQGATGWRKIQSVFSLVRMWGGGVAAAYVLQTIVALAALALAAWIWRGKATLATRAAALCAAMLLTTPYLLDYDLTILAVPIALMAQQGTQSGFRRHEKLLVALLWLLPLLARELGGWHIPPTPFALAGLLAQCAARRDGGKAA